MTLFEMSASYRDSAAAIHGRIVELRGLERAQADPERSEEHTSELQSPS